jgi:hypothetical protein
MVSWIILLLDSTTDHGGVFDFAGGQYDLIQIAASSFVLLAMTSPLKKGNGFHPENRFLDNMFCSATIVLQFTTYFLKQLPTAQTFRRFRQG